MTTNENNSITEEMIENFLNASNSSTTSTTGNGNSSVTGVNNAQSFCNQIHSLENNIQAVINQNLALKVVNNRLQKDIYELWDTVYRVECDLAKFQQYSRRENIEIIGIPDTVKQHELEKTVISMLRRIGVENLSSYEIAGCHRLKKTNRDKPANVIVRFTNRKRAHQSLENRRYLKQYVPEYRNIYIVENLCPRYKEMFEECQKLKNDGKIKQVWTWNGIVHIKKTDTERYGKKLFHISELEEIVPELKDLERMLTELKM